MSISLYEKGYDIEGIDLSQRHLDIIHNSHPDLYTAKEDWTDIKSIPNEKYDSIFSLGRNIMHEYLPNRQMNMFKEANRIMKLGGKFIFDVPDSNKGQYKNLISIFQ